MAGSDSKFFLFAEDSLLFASINPLCKKENATYFMLRIRAEREDV